VIACAFATAPNERPPAGIPPYPPGSTVSVIKSSMASSLATEATPSGTPIPRFTMAFIFRNIAARRAMAFRSLNGMGAMVLAETFTSPV